MGLIDLQMSGTKKKPLLGTAEMLEAGAFGYDPERRTVDQAKESVAGQLEGLLKADSPLLQRARAGAMQTANARGLINSSIAAGAGEAAVIDAALPIANADAQVYGTASRDNQLAGNTALQLGADATNRAALTNTSEGNAFSKMREQAGYETSLQTLRGNQATGLADIEANYRTLLGASDSASKLYTSITQGMVLAMADPNTTPEQKQAAIDRLSSLLRSGLTITGGIANIDLASLLSFGV